MANPFVPPGNLNRVRASVVWSLFPQLNVTAPFLSKAGISLTFTGAATLNIDAMTGRVTSPEPYLGFDLTINLLRTNGLAALYKQQQELYTLLGDCTIRTDAMGPAAPTPYYLSNANIISAGSPQSFAGQDPDFPVHISGTYYINAAMWG